MKNLLNLLSQYQIAYSAVNSSFELLVLQVTIIIHKTSACAIGQFQAASLFGVSPTTISKLKAMSETGHEVDIPRRSTLQEDHPVST